MDQDETIAASTVPALTREQAREAIRLAYVSGSASLAVLSCRFAVPYDTVRRWSLENGWSVTRKDVASIADAKTSLSLANWLSEQRTEQQKRAISRSKRLQDAIDKALPEGERLAPKDIASLATAEEKADKIIRENLGMTGASTSGPVFNVNALGGVTIIE